MTDLKSIRKFEYRPCRISTGFDVDFEVGDETMNGLCRDVSDTGVRVMLEGSVAVGDSGVLTLRHPTGILKVQAHVAYLDKGHVGLVFVFEAPWERTAVIEYIAAIASLEVTSMIVGFP